MSRRLVTSNAPRSASRFGLLASMLFLGGCGAESDPRTQVMAVVALASGLPASALAPVEIDVFAGAAEEPRPAWARVHAASFPARDLPVELAIIPAEGDASRRYEVRVTTSDRSAGEDLLVAVRSGFVAGQTLELAVPLRSTCLERTGGCVTTVPPEALPPYGQSSGGGMDAGPAPARDGGGANPDGGGPDAGPEECRFDVGCPESADPCQRGACIEGRCELVPNQGAVCDDGDVCTVDDRCDVSGSCRGEAACGINETCDGSAGDAPICKCIDGAVRCDGGCRIGAC